ncbi:MAG: hypothetical protein R8P61_32630 [Bacteroidia bacterium]|nr:hypothetical protein [Bacteroidia bacterium]
MKKLAIMGISIMFLGVMFFSCQSESKSKTEDIKNEMGDLAESITEALQEEKKDLSEEIQLMQGQIDTELDSLEKELENISENAKEDMQTRMKFLRQKQDSLDKSLDQIGTAIKEDWKEIKTKSEQNLEELAERLKKGRDV